MDNKESRSRVGIDIGGTFTDLLLFDPVNRRFTFGKTLTTPADPSEGVTSGFELVVAEADQQSSDVGMIVHGTTLVTNALIEGKGAKTALLTTKGFRDAVEIGREHRYDLYDLDLERPQPLTPRYLRFEIDERTLADGSELTPLDQESVRVAVANAIAEGVEAVAVCFLHSYQNPDHEREALAIIEAEGPGLTVSVSSEVVPEIREYERVSTTIANVYVRPIVATYLARLVESLADLGFDGAFLIMHSSGGLCTVETASTHPIRLVESGPAAGALAAAHYGSLTGRSSILAFDMGGTTAKCCLIEDFKPAVSAEFEVNRVYRFKKGSGLPIKAPVIELIEIGSGGGSIARVDRLGLLKVGPDSAGADPGPACYGRGGSQPTVTDADLVLGYLDHRYFLGGTMKLDLAASEQAIAGLAAGLGIEPIDAAWGIHQVVNEQMASAARIHAVEQGKDPREYPVYAFGGAGPVHAWQVATILGSPEVIVPYGAGIASTIGFLVAPLAFDFVRSYVGVFDELDLAQVDSRFVEMEQEGREMLAQSGVGAASVSLNRTAELRYEGQGHEIRVPVPQGPIDASAMATLANTFEQRYREIFGRVPVGNRIEAINWRLTASAPPPELPIDIMVSREAPSGTAIKGMRSVYLPTDRDYRQIPVYDRYQLRPGDQFAGPAIVEERESTFVVNSSAAIRIGELGEIIAVRA